MSDIETRRWNWSCQFGRLQIRWCLMRHRYTLASDRWVWQLSIIYDRAEAKTR